MRRLGWQWAVLCAGLFWTLGSAVAGEPGVRAALPDGLVAVLEVERPADLVQYPLWSRLVGLLQKSPQYQDTLLNPQFDPARDLIQFAEQEYQRPIVEVLRGAAGRKLLVGVGPNPERQWIIVVEGQTSEDVARIPVTLLNLARQIQSSRGAGVPEPVVRNHNGVSFASLAGMFHYAVADRVFVLTNQAEWGTGLLDRLAGTSKPAEGGISNSPLWTADDVPHVQLLISGDWVRKVPDLQKAVNLPYPDGGQLFVFGGWWDLVRRSEFLSLELQFQPHEVTAVVKASAKAAGAPESLKPFFGTTADAQAWPLLRVPNSVLTASWYRDYAAIWHSRQETLNGAELKKIEDNNAETAKRNKGVGPLDAMQALGPHFRLFVCRTTHSPYEVPLADHLPAMAAMVDLKDEADFRDRILPPAQEFGNIIALLTKLIQKSVEYKQATLRVFRYTEDEATVAQGDRIRYHFEPTYAITRGHLIVGSTSDMVRAAIDALDAQAANPTSEPPATERQEYDFAQLAGLVGDLHELALRAVVLDEGVPLPQAEQELRVVQQLIGQLGKLTVAAGDQAQGFEYRIRLQPQP